MSMEHQKQEHRYMRLTFWVVVLMSVAVIILLALQIIDTSQQSRQATRQAEENAILIETNLQLIDDLGQLVEESRIQREKQVALILCVLQAPVIERTDELVAACRAQTGTG